MGFANIVEPSPSPGSHVVKPMATKSFKVICNFSPLSWPAKAIPGRVWLLSGS